MIIFQISWFADYRYQLLAISYCYHDLLFFTQQSFGRVTVLAMEMIGLFFKLRCVSLFFQWLDELLLIKTPPRNCFSEYYNCFGPLGVCISSQRYQSPKMIGYRPLVFVWSSLQIKTKFLIVLLYLPHVIRRCCPSRYNLFLAFIWRQYVSLWNDQAVTGVLWSCW